MVRLVSTGNVGYTELTFTISQLNGTLPRKDERQCVSQVSAKGSPIAVALRVDKAFNWDGHMGYAGLRICLGPTLGCGGPIIHWHFL